MSYLIWSVSAYYLSGNFLETIWQHKKESGRGMRNEKRASWHGDLQSRERGKKMSCCSQKLPLAQKLIKPRNVSQDELCASLETDLQEPAVK